MFSLGELRGTHVLITAGPTREALDPVRFITNRSSGRMGFALAQSALEAGAEVTLISGPVAIPPPPGVRRIDVESAQQMFDAVMQEVRSAQIFIACAAVSDYRSRSHERHKIKKTRETLTIELTRNPDIVGTVAGLDAAPFVLGFAAETRDLERYARAKLEKKSLDMIAANLVGAPNSGFDSDFNALEIFWKNNGHRSLERGAKIKLARQLITILTERYAASNKTIE
jgi:phosphopantothenoylcysteine decarboxylase/phosphopantothenate--cysteine ligase